MEHKVGETFQYKDVTLQVVACDGSLCTGCYFHKNGHCTLVAGEEGNVENCGMCNRKDRTSVFFKQINIDKDMEKELDLTKILDGCPQDTEFYNDTFGRLRFCGIVKGDHGLCISLKDYYGYTRAFYSNGYYFEAKGSNCKLSLFPSDEQRDWSRFERFWDDTNKTEGKHFDPKTLKPFDKVLVRDSDVDVWQCEMFSHFCSRETTYPYFCCGGPYYYCIPYNSETEHILGTSEEAPAFYRYWEEQS